MGTCPSTADLQWAEASLSLVERYRLMLGRKGIPFGSNARYLRRHGGRLWPVYFWATYVKLALDHFRARLERAASLAGGRD